MAEYIERKAGCRRYCFHYDACFYHITEETKRLTVNECPLYHNKADVVEVVRCKDCKRCEMCFPCKAFGLEAPPVYVCRLFHRNREVLPNDYCSYGAKMDGKEEKEDG